MVEATAMPCSIINIMRRNNAWIQIQLWRRRQEAEDEKRRILLLVMLMVKMSSYK
jgi:hypothetical protein